MDSGGGIVIVATGGGGSSSNSRRSSSVGHGVMSWLVVSLTTMAMRYFCPL